MIFRTCKSFFCPKNSQKSFFVAVNHFKKIISKWKWFPKKSFPNGNHLRTTWHFWNAHGRKWLVSGIEIISEEMECYFQNKANSLYFWTNISNHWSLTYWWTNLFSKILQKVLKTMFKNMKEKRFFLRMTSFRKIDFFAIFANFSFHQTDLDSTLFQPEKLIFYLFKVFRFLELI